MKLKTLIKWFSIFAVVSSGLKAKANYNFELNNACPGELHSFCNVNNQTQAYECSIDLHKPELESNNIHTVGWFSFFPGRKPVCKNLDNHEGVLHQSKTNPHEFFVVPPNHPPIDYADKCSIDDVEDEIEIRNEL